MQVKMERLISSQIIIYGAGNYGKLFLNTLRELNLSVDCFCTTKKTQNMVEGIEVIDLLELNNRIIDSSDTIIFIAVKDKKCSKEIKEAIKGVFNTLPKVLYVGDVIRQIEEARFYSQKSDSFCNYCGINISGFYSYGEKSDLFLRHKVIGGGFRERCICPICNSMDRERWLKIVLERYTDILHNKCRVLHIAPEENTERLISNNLQCDYYTGDIETGRAKHIVDLTKICYIDSFFDYVIANHVLEHIPNEQLALSEIYRVLRNNGKFIVSFPLCLEMETIEELGDISEEEKLRRFGQKDHVRLYGSDYKSRLTNAGFDVKTYSPEEYLSSDIIHELGLIPEDVIMVCEKR